MIGITTLVSTLDSSAALNIAALQQHQAHKERQDRIRKAALKDLNKPLPPVTGAQSPPVTSNEFILPKPELSPEQYLTIFDLIMRRVCDRYNVRKDDILSQRRLGNIVKARHAAIVMLYKFTKWTNFKIADKLKRDPSTIFYVLQKHEHRPFDFSELERQIQDSLPLINPIIKI